MLPKVIKKKYVIRCLTVRNATANIIISITIITIIVCYHHHNCRHSHQ
jgi:hypothetical protein